MVTKEMGTAQVLRQIGTVVLLPVYILIGMAVSDVASKLNRHLGLLLFRNIYSFVWFDMYMDSCAFL